jgi:hypothetical protein
MQSKKVTVCVFLIFAGFIIIYLALYYKVYRIKINANEVYEIDIRTGLDTKIITVPQEIKEYLDKVLAMKYTHPRILTGKGWTSAVCLKLRSDNGNERKFEYIIANNMIQFGSIEYKIIQP